MDKEDLCGPVHGPKPLSKAWLLPTVLSVILAATSLVMAICFVIEVKNNNVYCSNEGQERMKRQIFGQQGPPGPQGPVGPQGPQGYPGFQGEPGSLGQRGNTIPVSLTKSELESKFIPGGQGATGWTGPTGRAGATGFTGPMGAIRATGAPEVPAGRLTVCRNSQCRNGGVCVPNGDGYYCDCPNNFYGSYCQFSRATGGSCSFCGPAPTIVNGNSNSSRISHTCGSVVVYTCHAQFSMFGDNRITCNNGKWDYVAPSCRTQGFSDACDCGTPPRATNGYYYLPLGGGTTCGSSVGYRCNSGYTLFGKDRITCINGNWDDAAPSCWKVGSCSPCGSAPTVVNGYSNSSQASHPCGSIVSYICYSQFNMIGNSKITCNDGRWEDAPSCRIVSCSPCGSAPTVVNGYSNSSQASHPCGSGVSYTCYSQFNMIGNSRITCNNGRWDEAPSCRTRTDVCDCGTPVNVANGYYYVSSSTGGTTCWSSVTYTCLSGYTLYGNEKVYCNNGRRDDAPSCRRTGSCTCGTAPTIPNAFTMSPSQLTYSCGSYVEYRCNNGYDINGDNRLTCTNGNWGTLPSCQRRCSCGPAPHINGGYYEVTGTTCGSTATYTCNDGYFMIGLRTVDCNNNGQWGNVPSCSSSCTCGAVPTIPDTSTSSSQIVYRNDRISCGSHVEFTCNFGFNMQGSSRVTCTNGNWGTLPSCQRRCTCGPAPQIDGGYFTLTGTACGSTATYTCYDGYDLQGLRVVDCNSNGQWGNVPSCSRDETNGGCTCDPAPYISGGYYSTTGSTCGSTTTYNCYFGYQMQGPRVVTCSNGRWNNVPSCFRIERSRDNGPGFLFNTGK